MLASVLATLPRESVDNAREKFQPYSIQVSGGLRVERRNGT